MKIDKIQLHAFGPDSKPETEVLIPISSKLMTVSIYSDGIYGYFLVPDGLEVRKEPVRYKFFTTADSIDLTEWEYISSPEVMLADGNVAIFHLFTKK